MKQRFRDYEFLLYLIPLLVLGILNLASASKGMGVPYHMKQLLWIAVGFVFFFLVSSKDYRTFEAYAYPLYALGIFLLVLVLFLGKEVAGAKRWFAFGGLSFQPSEFMKLAFVLALAKHFSDHPPLDGLGLKDLKVPLVLAGGPVLLIALEPDLGTALSFLAILGLMVFYWGMEPKAFLILILLVVAGAFGGWFLLRDYQKERILAFLDPYSDPLGSGYHLIQSKIAVGSGGLLGKGMGEGTQSRLGFLPECHTDFAFALFGEERGLVGCLLVLGLYLGLILWGIDTARKAKDKFGAFLSIGLTAKFFLHVAVNVGMVLGLLPVVGMPLPFLSYGGSFTLISFICLGLLFNVRRKRFMLTP